VTSEELSAFADAWIAYWHLPEGSPEKAALHNNADLYDLEYHDPETLWGLILLIHQKDQSMIIDQVLSAGPVENLLNLHGERFIDRVEAEARKDPTFAKVLGGVWQNTMGDHVWQRLQAVWDRRGWDGIAE
jgi:hypothetical protein